jgi:hypothetical protein
MSANRKDRTSALRKPPNSIAHTIARSRWVRNDATNRSTASASRDSGSNRGCRTSRPPARGRPGPRCPSGPRATGRSPCPRRGEGTGLSVRIPVITRYSNNARTAATRRLIVDAAALPPFLLAGLHRGSRRTSCQSIHSNTSTGVTAATARSRSSRNRAKLSTSKAYARTVAALNPRPTRCTRNAFAAAHPSHGPSIA